MKKVRITLKDSSPGKKFYLFPDAESLYVFMDALEHGEQLQIDDLDEVLLEKDDFIEAELIGFEYAYDGQTHRRFDLIRLGKVERPKNSSGTLVSVHRGWVSGGLLPMRNYEDADIDINVIDNPEDASIDLPAMFGDDDEHDDVTDLVCEDCEGSCDSDDDDE